MLPGDRPAARPDRVAPVEVRRAGQPAAPSDRERRGPAAPRVVSVPRREDSSARDAPAGASADRGARTTARARPASSGRVTSADANCLRADGRTIRADRDQIGVTATNTRRGAAPIQSASEVVPHGGTIGPGHRREVPGVSRIVLPASGSRETTIVARRGRLTGRDDPGHRAPTGREAAHRDRRVDRERVRMSVRDVTFGRLVATSLLDRHGRGRQRPMSSGAVRLASGGEQVGHHDEHEGRRFAVAIDGPAAAGKSTVGELVAERLHAVYFDTGILYRALTLEAIRHGIGPDDEQALAALARELDVRVQRPSVRDGRQSDVLLAGEDVTWELRSGAVDRVVSEISALPEVRKALLETQRRIGRSGRVVMVGRDIGTVVLPDADLKIFLIASVDERARRRYEQFRGTSKSQELDIIRADLHHRDAIDSERDVAPLQPADDAILVDTDRLTIDEVVDRVIAAADERLVAGQQR